MTTKAGFLGALVIAAFAAGCSQDATAPSTATSPVTETLAGALAVRGTTTHTFSIAQGGTISLTLTSVSPPATAVIGLGIGVPNATGAGCNLTRVVNTGAGSSPQLTATVETGIYCVSVYDVGNLADVGSFALTIVHP